MHVSTNKDNEKSPSLSGLMKKCLTKRLKLGAFASKYVKIYSYHVLKRLILTCSQIDNVNTSRRISGEPIVEAASPPPERAEIIPEVRHSIHLAFRIVFSYASDI